MTENHSVILTLLDEVGRRDTERVHDEAHAAGHGVYTSMMKEAQKRSAMRDQKHQEETAFLKSREIARYKNKAALAVNEAKIKHIDVLLDEVYQALQKLDQQGFIDLLTQSLNRHKTEERPRIHVAPNRYEGVVHEFGQSYQIIQDESISDGFILNYTHFDVNMELKQIMRHKHDLLTQLAMVSLFGGDDA